jgi:protein SCO1/2
MEGNKKWINALTTFFALSIILLCVIHLRSKRQKVLPIYGSRSVNPVTHDTLYHQVLNFKLTDQMSQTVTLDTFRNKIFTANFFFASCPGLCKKMNSEMERVEKRFAGNSTVKFISYTVTPEQDSVQVLAAYAKIHNAVPYQWYFLTGDKKEILNQARFSYNLECDNYLVHSQNITLVDKKGHIRGVYCGTLPPEMDRLIKDIELLLHEKT